MRFLICVQRSNLKAVKTHYAFLSELSNQVLLSEPQLAGSSMLTVNHDLQTTTKWVHTLRQNIPRLNTMDEFSLLILP